MHNQSATPAHTQFGKGELKNIHFSPYLGYALKLAAKPRRGGGNMFRHQMETFAVLLDYGYFQPVILKASLIHDLIEDSDWTDFYAFEEIACIDEDGAAVLALVKEISQRVVNGQKEPKGDFLLRVMLQGSEQVKILKLADRISNLSGLPHYGDIAFIRGYIIETEQYIVPFASKVDTAMAEEINRRLKSLKNSFQP
ncbi:MAG: hypothetical protein IH598_17045 [Bacteroidales bacterium]|nr:hypothetical protein [Bacteroidales bacterium]